MILYPGMAVMSMEGLSNWLNRQHMHDDAYERPFFPGEVYQALMPRRVPIWEGRIAIAAQSRDRGRHLLQRLAKGMRGQFYQMTETSGQIGSWPFDVLPFGLDASRFERLDRKTRGHHYGALIIGQGGVVPRDFLSTMNTCLRGLRHEPHIIYLL